MIKGIQPKPLIEVGKMFAHYLGKNWERDRNEIVDIINEFREYLYIDPEMPDLFTEKYYCLSISTFHDVCTCTCSCEGNKYKGVVIPDDIDGILDVWVDNEPLRTHSRWWEGRVGRITGNNITKSTIPTNQIRPTRRMMRKAGDLVIHATNAHDNGKEVVIDYIDCLCDVQKVKVTLDEKSPKIIKDVHGIKSISSPSDLAGSWKLSESDGYELGEYTKHNSIPQYQVLKISVSDCACDKVLIQGNQKFEPVCYDHDIVEVGSRVIIKHAASMLTYDDALDTPSLSKSELERRKMLSLVLGAFDRNKGKQEQDNIVRRSATLIPNKLSYRR